MSLHKHTNSNSTYTSRNKNNKFDYEVNAQFMVKFVILVSNYISRILTRILVKRYIIYCFLEFFDNFLNDMHKTRGCVPSSDKNPLP
jgi:hypothetical protein